MEHDSVIVCLVGENIRHTPGVARRVFNALDGINIRMICQGASLLNISFVVAESRSAARRRRAARRVLRQLDPDVFERKEAVHALKLAIVGYGKMGRLIEQLAPEYGFEVALKLDEFNNVEGEGITAANFQGVDVAIEFSIPAAVRGQRGGHRGAGREPVVVGTTGWLGAHRAGRSRRSTRHGTGLVWSPNFSIGVNVFFRLVAEAARLLASEPAYGAWAWEIHHATKKDAPSGTLLKLVEEMKKAGYARPIDVGSNRAGAHPGHARNRLRFARPTPSRCATPRAAAKASRAAR